MDKPDPVQAKVDDKDNKQEEEKFKKGDYSVHLFIEESKGLLPVSDDKNFNPVITVKCFNKMKCTKKLKDVTSGATSLWGEHIYFSKLNCTVSELESEKILIEVKDSRTLKDSLIGSYELDFTYVYFQPRHSIIHQWIILSNPYSEDVTVQRGLVKVGVNILHENDKAEDLTTKGSADSLIIPPQVNVKSVQLIIQIVQAIGLPKMDSSGTCDAYCVASFSTSKNRSKTITADKGTMSVNWSQELWLPVCQPCIANKVNITIWDYDKIGDDQLIGSLSFHWDKILDEANSKFMWSQIYGAPDNVENEAAVAMNTNEKLASHWRGRVLLRLFRRDSEKANLKTLDIPPKEIQDIAQELEIESNYQLNVQVFEGVNLPNKTGTYSIALRFADGRTDSKPVDAVSGCCKWYETLKRKVIGIPDMSNVPDIFVYLLLDKVPVCYARLKQAQYNNPFPKERWVKLIPDPSIGKVANLWEGGYILMRVFVGLEDAHGYDKKLWDAKIGDLSLKTTKKLVCNLYQCRNLPAADPTGLADPYVKIMCGASEVCTDQKAKEGILNPLWYEPYVMDISIASPETAPPIIVQVWDYDAGSTDDVMGICTIDMSTVPVNPTDAPRPIWHKLNLGTDDSEEGEILIAFMVVDKEAPQFFMPTLTEVSIEIYALGFRDLKPALGWLPVNKAFLKVDIRAIQLPGEQSLVTELATQPNSQGPNPNIGSVLTFKTKIPVDPLFCPNLTCTVYDFLLSGKSQPILGTFNLDLHHVYSKKLKDQDFFQQAKEAGKKISLISSGIAHKPPVVAIKEKVEGEGEDVAEGEALLGRGNMVVPESVEKAAVKFEETKVKRESFSVAPMSLSEAKEQNSVVIMPQYKPRQSDPKKFVEVKLVDKHYVPLGYNREPNDGKKHYRYALETSLEKSVLFGNPPFQVYNIKKGQTRGASPGFFSLKKASAEDNQLTDAGVFKGLVRIKNTHKQAAESNDSFDQIARLLLIKSECIVRVNIVDAFNLDEKDIDSPSDPYIVLKLGNQRISDRNNKIMDNSCPKFLKSFDLTTSFPGESTLKLQIWDFNDLFADEKIGTAKIDLEDRFFNESWKSMPEKPIETCKLLVKSCKQPKGFVRLWIEIFPSNKVPPPLDLSPKPAEPFELRLVIWRSEEVPNMDAEGVSDLYVVAAINDGEKKETDTHYRAQNGVGSWNWRMKFKMMLDENSQCILNMSIWDRDLLSSNDAIGDACLDLTDLAKYAVETGDKVKKYGTSARFSERALRKESEKFFVEFKTRDQNGVEKGTGKVMISVEILPEARAIACNNGEGRSEPNIEPLLAPPEGRITLTANPIKMMTQMVGPELKQKICMYACLGFCVFLCILMFPMLTANAFSAALF